MDNIATTVTKKPMPIPLGYDEDDIPFFEVIPPTIDDYENEIVYYGEPVPDWARE